MTSDGLSDHFMQFLLNIINEGYEQYKLDHPDFARIVERDLEGKTDAEFEAQFTNKNTTCPHCGEYNFRDEIINGCCHECGKWFY